jgi:hypothetical protein
VNSARLRSIFVYILIVVAIIVLLFQFRQQANSTQPWTLTEVAKAVEAGTVRKIVVDENILEVTLKSGEE